MMMTVVSPGHAGGPPGYDQGELGAAAARGPGVVQHSAGRQGARLRVGDRGEDQGLHLPADLPRVLR